MNEHEQVYSTPQGPKCVASPASPCFAMVGREVGRTQLPLKRATQIFEKLDVRRCGWLELRGATRALASFGLSNKEHEGILEILERAARSGERATLQGRTVSRANFLKEAVSHGPDRFSKSPSPVSKGTKPSTWSHRGVVTPGARQGQVDSRRSPTSSRPSSPRSEETKSSLPASPEVSLSPSRLGFQDSWWQLPRKAACVS
eukprot:s4963_g4.t1